MAHSDRFCFGISILLSIFLCSSCNKDNHVEEIVKTKCNHIIFIGLDGWGGQYDVNEMPFLKGKIGESLYTFDKKAVLPTGSAPNWASIFMGVPPEVHGYIEWDAKKPSIEYDFELANNIYPTIFQKLRKTKPEYEIGMFCQWDGIKYLVDTLSCSYSGCYPIKQYSHRQFTDYVISYIKSSKPHFCAIVFDDPDATGHKEGFYSQGYNKKLRELDKCIEDIYQTVQDSKFLDSTVFIVTSDHGGKNKTHGGDSPEEILTPLFVFGKPLEKVGKINNVISQTDLLTLMTGLLAIEEESHSIILSN